MSKRRKERKKLEDKIAAIARMAVVKGICSVCEKSVNLEDPATFRDQASVNEYHRSGRCQACQDKLFVNGSSGSNEYTRIC